MKKLQITRSFTLLGTLVGGVVLALPAGCGSTPSSGAVGNGGATHATAAASGPLGIVALGESHQAGEAGSLLFVSAAFVSDASQAVACTETVEGCSVPKVAVCDGQTGPVCGEGEVCVLDATCEATCEVPCTAQCDTGEECFADGAGNQACRVVPTFDAGALALTAASGAIALAPPYAFEPGDGTPSFVPGGSVRVTAAGSTSGFAPFDQTFIATSAIGTSLAALTSSALQAHDAIPITWAPLASVNAHDAIVVSVTGPKGMAQCPAFDASGRFDLPRSVVDAVLAPGAASVTLSVTRERSEVRALAGGGALDLRSSSTETRTFDL